MPVSVEAEAFMREWDDKYDDTVQYYPYSTPDKAMRFTTIGELMRAVESSGSTYFGAAEKRFFRSKIYGSLYGGRFFVSSEKADDDSPRLYSVCYVYDYGDGGRLQIEKLGGFQRFDTLDKARRVAQKAARVLG